MIILNWTLFTNGAAEDRSGYNQESGSQRQVQEPTMNLAYGSKREISSSWLPPFFAGFFYERALLQSQILYKICSTCPCLSVSRDTDLKGYPMSLSHSQPLTGQSIQSNLMTFLLYTRMKDQAVGWFLIPWLRNLLLRQLQKSALALRSLSPTPESLFSFGQLSSQTTLQG